MARLKRATLKSIASDLGVTHTSVSNAYNNPAKVSKALRDRIIAHARSVNYEGPNPAARSLRTGRCGAIGVLFNDRLSYAFRTSDRRRATSLQQSSTASSSTRRIAAIRPSGRRSPVGCRPWWSILTRPICRAC
jgi:hypothetical protein